MKIAFTVKTNILVKGVDLNTLINIQVPYVLDPQVTKMEIKQYIVEPYVKRKIYFITLILIL